MNQVHVVGFSFTKQLLVYLGVLCFPSHHLMFVFTYMLKGVSKVTREEENDGGRNGTVPHKHIAVIRFQPFCATVSVG